jgi:hypothetical protein
VLAEEERGDEEAADGKEEFDPVVALVGEREKMGAGVDPDDGENGDAAKPIERAEVAGLEISLVCASANWGGGRNLWYGDGGHLGPGKPAS